MQNNGFKKSLFGLNGKQVMEYLDTLSGDVEKKVKMKDDDIKSLKSRLSAKEKEAMSLEEKLEEAQAELEKIKTESEKELSELKNAHQLELSELKLEHNKELAEINEKLSELKAESSKERDKISSAILNAENTAKKIIAEAQIKSDELIENAQKKAELEKMKLNQTKADVSDFTYDIKKLLEKLNTDLKDKLKGND